MHFVPLARGLEMYGIVVQVGPWVVFWHSSLSAADAVDQMQMYHQHNFGVLYWQ